MNDRATRGLAIGAAAVTITLTAAAFWLSYEHLHDVATHNGMADAGARAWAWPGTIDAFIIVGELLMLRASLARHIDWWAVSLTAGGSVGSIALNVIGVGPAANPMQYAVAAMPPTAALVAFGALMRQLHAAIAGHPVVVEAPQPPVEEDQPEPVEAATVTEPLPADEPEPAGNPEPEPDPLTVEPEPTTAPAWTFMQMPPWPAETHIGPTSPITAVAADTGRRTVVTGVVTEPATDYEPVDDHNAPAIMTPAQLLRAARRLDRQLIAETGKPVTIDRLRDEFQLSRRDAAALRHDIKDMTK